MIPLSHDEKQLLDCMNAYFDTHHYSPGVRDLKTAMGHRSQSKTQVLLNSLRNKKYITWQKGHARSYQILVRGIPICGAIQAGVVVEHPENTVERLLNVPYQSDLYALKVYGDSMIEDHICEGDMVVMKSTPDLWALRRDAIAAVWVDGEGATLKHVKFDGQWVWLNPANSNYSPRQVRPDQIQLQGIMVQLFRNYETL